MTSSLEGALAWLAGLLDVEKRPEVPYARLGLGPIQALLALADGEGESVFLFADGAPCQNQYEDFTPLLHELARGTRPVAGESVARKFS